MSATDIRPRVSVIIPAYNAESCISRSIRSVQSQTEQDFEIIVIDDASSDRTVDVVSKLSDQDPRITLLQSPTNAGPSSARNAGLDHARGRWLALLDADDAFKPDRLEALCAIAERNDLDAIGDDIVYFDDAADCEVRAGHFVRPDGVVPVTMETYLESATYRVGVREALYREDKPISLLKLIMRASKINGDRIRYSSKYRYCEDFIFYFDLLRSGAKIAVLGRPLYIYTEPLGSVSRASSPHSRTVADRQSIVAAIDEILSSGVDLTPRQKQLLRTRRASTLSAVRYAAFRSGTLGHRKYQRYWQVALRPRFWLRFARELRHGLESRLRHRARYGRRG